MAWSFSKYDGAVRIDPDAYGELLLAAYEGRAAHEVMERDDGLLYVGDPSDYFAPFRRWPAAERKAMRFVRGRTLDVGAGAGRVSLHLQERGHEVVAIDASPLALEVCRRRGVNDTQTRSLADLDGLGVFDTVLILRNNLGLAGAPPAAAHTAPPARRYDRRTPASSPTASTPRAIRTRRTAGASASASRISRRRGFAT